VLVVIVVLRLRSRRIVAQQPGQEHGGGVAELAQAHARRQQQPPGQDRQQANSKDQYHPGTSPKPLLKG
jgi:hypothetical protein